MCTMEMLPSVHGPRKTSPTCGACCVTSELVSFTRICLAVYASTSTKGLPCPKWLWHGYNRTEFQATCLAFTQCAQNNFHLKVMNLHCATRIQVLLCRHPLEQRGQQHKQWCPPTCIHHSQSPQTLARRNIVVRARSSYGRGNR